MGRTCGTNRENRNAYEILMGKPKRLKTTRKTKT
jgi:hypothetical protein